MSEDLHSPARAVRPRQENAGGMPALPGTKPGLQLGHEPNRCVDVMTMDGALLFRYVYNPDTPIAEARRPYAHPVNSIAGDRLTNFRPNDHPWHHALSLTITRVDEVNFWGGPSYRAADGYRWREDHGVQMHVAWTALAPGEASHMTT